MNMWRGRLARHLVAGTRDVTSPAERAVIARVRGYKRGVPRDPAFTARLRAELIHVHAAQTPDIVHEATMRPAPSRLARASWRLVLFSAVLSFGTGVAAARVLPGAPTADSAVRTIPVGQDPSAIAVDEATSRAFVINGGNPTTGIGNVSVLDTRTGTLLRNIGVGVVPIALAADGSTGHVFVINSYIHAGGQGTVSVLDARTGQVMLTEPVGDVPYAVAVNERAGRAFVLNANDSGVSVLDTTTGRRVGIIHTSPNGGPLLGPNVLAVDARRGRLLSISPNPSGGSVNLFDTRSGRLVGAPLTPGMPIQAVADEQTGHGFIAGSRDVSMLDMLSGKVLSTVAGSSYPLAVDARRGLVYAGHFEGGVDVLNAASGRVVRHIALKGDANPLTVDEQSGRVLIAHTGPFAGGAPSGDGSVSVVDGTTGTIVRTVTVGRYPVAAAIDGRTGHAFILNEFSNTVSMLDMRH